MKRLTKRIKKFFRTHRYAAAAFFLPALILVGAFAVTGIYPFGENQITIIDMYHQYVPFLSDLQYKLQHGGSLLYSWNGAGGHDFWTLMSYYGGSPLNLLLFFFPAGLIVEGVTFILVLKVGFSGMFMYLYLKRTYPKPGDPAIGIPAGAAGVASRPKLSPGAARARARAKATTAWGLVVFGSMYALSAYFIGYFWCIMWIDVMALLPLCMLGLRRLVNQGRPVMYTVSLALIIFCNYYIAIMVCLFTVLYYLVVYFERPRGDGVLGFIRTTALVALFSLVGALISAFRFLPTWRAMENAYYFADDWPLEWSFYHDPLEIVNQLLPNAHVCFREGLPNIYCGLLVVMMLAVYFTSRTIPLRGKIANGALLAVMFFSLNVNMLDFVWHGLHFPNELPFRYSFVISFVLVQMGYQGFIRLRQTRPKVLWAVFAGGLGYYFLAANLLDGALDNKEEFFYLGTGLLILYTAVLMVYRKGLVGGRGFSCLLILVVALELLSSSALGFEKAGNVERDPYLDNAENIEKLVSGTRDDFARTEMFRWSLMNCPALYHYRGISQFASSLNSNATYLMEQVGVEGEPGKNRYNYVFSSPVLNAMLNMKYIISEGEVLEDPRFTVRDESGGCTLYENSQPLAMGYMLPESILSWQIMDVNPFYVQNDYVRAATDGKVGNVLVDIGNPTVTSDEMEVSEEGDGVMQSTGGDGIRGIVDLNYKIPKDGQYYIYMEADQAESIQVFRESGDVVDLRNDCGAVVYIGSLTKDETIDVQIDYEENGQGMIRSHVCRLDDEAWDKAYALISRDTMKVEDFGDTFIEGTINATEDGIFTTSVFYEDGWRLYVDGQRQSIDELVGEDFIATPLTAGEHQIRLKYIPEGFVPGLILTILGILLLILLPLVPGALGRTRAKKLRAGRRRQRTGLPKELLEDSAAAGAAQVAGAAAGEAAVGGEPVAAGSVAVGSVVAPATGESAVEAAVGEDLLTGEVVEIKDLADLGLMPGDESPDAQTSSVLPADAAQETEEPLQ